MKKESTNHFNLPAASKFKFLIFYAQNAKETNELLKGEKTNKTEAKNQQPSSLTFAYRTLSLIVSYLCQPLSIHKLHKAQTTSILAPVLNMNAFSGFFFYRRISYIYSILQLVVQQI